MLLETLQKEHIWEAEITLSRNEYLCKKGQMHSYCYFIVSGALHIYLENSDGEQTIRFGYTNNFITTLDSFINEQPTVFYIQALKKTTVKLISKEKLLSFINVCSVRQAEWTILFQQLVLQQLEREQDLLTSSPVERYNRVLKRSPQLFQEIPNKYIASYLRMTPETLSRLKKS